MNYPEIIYVDTDLVGQEEPKSGWQKYRRVDETKQINVTSNENCRWRYNFETKQWDTDCGNHVDLKDSATIQGWCIYCRKPIVL